jgi:hypothetical protein
MGGLKEADDFYSKRHAALHEIGAALETSQNPLQLRAEKGKGGVGFSREVLREGIHG